jgi:aminopeptidase N
MLRMNHHWVAMCLAFSAVAALEAAPVSRLYTVENYDVSIQPDLTKQLLYGEARIRFHTQADTAISALELDAGGLQITAVLEGQTPQYFERKGSLLVVVLTNPLHAEEHRTITVRYQAGPAPGLKFFPDQMYTTATSDWLPCNDRSGERATLRMTIFAPPDIKVAGSGQLTATRSGEGKSVTEWQVTSPNDPSWFGFALGSFTENTSEAEGVKLRVLGAGSQMADPTAAAIHYLAERTGKKYPSSTFTQVYAHGDVTRSMAGLTLLPESYAQGLAKQPNNLFPIAYGLAQQWYGVGIATKDWSDLWLSEGISAYLSDAFLGQKFGKETFEREIQHSRQIYNQLRAENKDRSLSDTDWTMRKDADGDIPEHKGAWFLYLVNEMIGESAFWDGLRLYTSDQWGQAATSEDLQKAFDAVNTGNHAADKKGGGGSKKGSKASEKNAPKTVDSLFDLWVFGVPNTGKSK